MSNHTPGPWAVVEGDSPGIKEISGPSFTILAVMWASDLNEDDFRKRYADLSLIASAPDMFEAMEYLATRLENLEDERIALDAIAKARGETG